MTTLKTRKKVFTLAEAGISASVAKRLEAEGVIVRVGTNNNRGVRGRPAVLYSKVG